MDLPESGFAVLWILFVSGYILWIYQRVGLLYFGHYPYLGQHICANSLSICTQTFCVNGQWTLKGSEDKDILCVNGLRIGHKTQRVDHRTDCWIQWTNLTVNCINRSLVRSGWFCYCLIAQATESIPVDCNHYFHR